MITSGAIVKVPLELSRLPWPERRIHPDGLESPLLNDDFLKEIVSSIVSDVPSSIQGLNLAKEYLQSRILGIVQEAGAMMPPAFCGGTALRFLYGLQRFSENLDFSLVGKDHDFIMTGYIDKVIHSLTREGYTILPKWNSSGKTVQEVILKFPGLPFELGLAARSTQNLSIRVEADTNPPSSRSRNRDYCCTKIPAAQTSTP